MKPRYSTGVLAQPRAAGSWLLRSAVAAALASAATVPAEAQDAPGASADQSPIQEVVVTGSRIVRRDFTSDSPLVTVSGQSLQNSSQIGIDQALSRLPQFVAGQNQNTGATDDQATPTSSPGISTVNLRGLGPNRSLVLLDGRRMQPANASLVVDLNTIPATAVDSVEIITGGAGSTYGADAVAGVVNFKLKHNYQGVTIDAQSGQTFDGDGAQSQISALLGSNFADNRGNAMLGITFSKRDQVYARDRSFFDAANTDPGTPGAVNIPSFPGFAGGTASQAAVNSVFSGFPAGDVPTSATIYFNRAGATADATAFSVAPGLIDKSPAPGYTGSLYPNHKVTSTGMLATNGPYGLLSLPLQRYSLFADAHYDFNEHATFYVQANFDQNDTRTQSIAGSPAEHQWAVNIPYDAAHPVPGELATLLNSRANPTAPWSLEQELSFLGPSRMDTTTTTYEILTGLRGTLGVKDWTYDLYASHGNTTQSDVYSGVADWGAYQALISLPNYGAGANFNNGRLGLVAHCTSGLNPFVTTPISQDCINILNSGLKIDSALKQDQVELDVQGGLFALPAGDLRGAVGADYRNDSYNYLPDRGITSTNITSNPVGLFDTSPTVGSISVKEAYVEVLAPILKDLPFVKALNLDGGFRYSDYSTAVGSANTWKITADWDVNDYVKIRGGRQIANRAPNVAELFQPPVFTNVTWPDSDPCAVTTRAAYGNVASNPNRAKVQALCSALAGGFPIGNTFVGNNPVYFNGARDLTQGNPNVKSEEAKTWTIGGVLRSPFDAELLRRMTLSVDYYSIEIDGAISPATTQVVYQECLNGLGTNPTYDPNNQYCKLILRDPTSGFWIATNAQYQNLAFIKTKGIDSQLDWNASTPFFGGLTGTVFTNLNFNYLQSYDVQVFSGAPVIHYAGTIASAYGQTFPYGAQFRWKLFSTLGYNVGPATFSLNWRHLPSVKNSATATSATATQLPTGSYDQIDLSGKWAVTSWLDVRGGVDNVFNRQPNKVGIVPGTTTAAGVTDVGTYDVLGRRFYVGVTAKF